LSYKGKALNRRQVDQGYVCRPFDNLITDCKLNINLGEELLIKDNIVVPKRGNKKRKVIKLAAVNLESELNSRGDRLA
jgi:hypothetical protein